MFTATQTLDNSSGSAHTFSLIQQDGTGTRRLDSNTTFADPTTLEIRHIVTGSGSKTIDRHLVRLQSQYRDSQTGDVVTLPINLTIAVPRYGDFSETNIKDLVFFLISFLIGQSLYDLDNTPDVSVILGLLVGES